MHQPFGAYPTAVYGRYDYDAAHLKAYVGHSKTGRIDSYLDTYVRGTKDHEAYLAKAGANRDALKAYPELGY